MGERKNKDRVYQTGLSGKAGPRGRICPDRHACEGWMCIDVGRFADEETREEVEVISYLRA